MMLILRLVKVDSGMCRCVQPVTGLHIGLTENCSSGPLSGSVHTHITSAWAWLVIQKLQGSQDEDHVSAAGKRLIAPGQQLQLCMENSVGRLKFLCTSAPATKTAAMALSNSAKTAGRRWPAIA